MRIQPGIFIVLMLLVTTRAAAWESSLAKPSADANGDQLFDGEHLDLTSKALTATDAFSFLDNPPEASNEVCATVKDFNTPAGDGSLATRKFCPAQFSELPDFSHSMEDYINQNRKCPPYLDWDAKECHSFEHFMGALNSSHFPPQTKANYTRYHQIAQAIVDLSGDLHNKLSAAEALPDYRSYYEECRLEALTYESIGQHYLQDQWSMGHMWHRWGGPEVSDYPTTGKIKTFGKLVLGEIARGTVVGGVSGLIHGWKSAVENMWLIPDSAENDAMCYYSSGVDWFTGDSSESLPVWPGWGDMYLDSFSKSDEFPRQKQVLNACMWESIWQLTPFQQTPSEIDAACWKNLATNSAMHIGLNLSPSSAAHQAIVLVGQSKSLNKEIKVIVQEASRDLMKLSTIFRLAARKHPYDTYLAEGYTSKSRDTRLEFLSIRPNDEYNRAPSYMDPARKAPGDPADLDGVQPGNPLFGVRQIRYFNKCHADLYCNDPNIVNDYRRRCRSSDSGVEVDCQICEELAGRFFIGEPPLCEILAPAVNPDPGGQKPPKTTFEVREWCRAVEQDCPEGEDCEKIESYYGDEDCSKYSSDFVEYRFCLGRNYRCKELKAYDEFGAHMYNGCLYSLEGSLVWDDPDAGEAVCNMMDWKPTKDQCLAHVEEVRAKLQK